MATQTQTMVEIWTQEEAEYMAAAAAVKEALWIRQLWKDLGLQDPAPIKIFSDNQAAISLLRNPVSSQSSKHIDILYHFARERVAMGQITFEYCDTTQQFADAFTKPVPPVKLQACITAWGMT